jgi:hypothetical protein
MSGWYVERLLLERQNIRDRLSSVEDTHGYDEPSCLVMNLDDDTYLDLLTVEAQLEKMIKENLVQDEELFIAQLVLSNKSYSQIEREHGISRITLAKVFKALCSRIAYYLGDHFTDEGFITYMQEKYDLMEEQVGLLIAYMDGNNRHNEIKKAKL